MKKILMFFVAVVISIVAFGQVRTNTWTMPDLTTNFPIAIPAYSQIIVESNDNVYLVTSYYASTADMNDVIADGNYVDLTSGGGAGLWESNAPGYISPISGVTHVQVGSDVNNWDGKLQFVASDGDLIDFDIDTDDDLTISGGDVLINQTLTTGASGGTSGKIYFVSGGGALGNVGIDDNDYITFAGFLRLVATTDFYLTGDIEQTGNINVTGAIDATGNVEGAYLESASGGMYLSNNWAVDGDGIVMLGGNMYFHVGSSLTARGYFTTDGDLFIQRDFTANGDGTFDTIVANVIQADKVGAGVYDGNFGQLWGDTLYMDTTVSSGLSDLVNVYMDSTTGQLYAQALSGGSSLWQDEGQGRAGLASLTSIEVDTMWTVGGREIFRSTGATTGHYGWNMATSRFGDETKYMQVQGSTGTATFEVDVADFNGTIVNSTGTIADNDATPDMGVAQVLTYAGSSNAVTITDLDNPVIGTTYTLIGNSDTYTVTIADGGNFNLSAQWVGGVDDVLILYVQADNDYIELGRVDN